MQDFNCSQTEDTDFLVLKQQTEFVQVIVQTRMVHIDWLRSRHSSSTKLLLHSLVSVSEMLKKVLWCGCIHEPGNKQMLCSLFTEYITKVSLVKTS